MASLEMDGGIKIYLREIGKTPLLTPEEEVELAVRIKKGDDAARSQMIQANLRLVVHIARDYANYGFPLLDIISEGNIGMMKAVEGFDPENGAKFSTYAAWWIKQSIKRALSNQSRDIRLPVHMVHKISKMSRIAYSMSEELGREPTDDELSKEIGIPRDRLFRLRMAGTRPASLDAPVGEDGDATFGDTVGDQRAENPLEALGGKEMRDKLPELLGILHERDRDIVERRFGLGEYEGCPQTLAEVGSIYNRTRERIRQLQDTAVEKLRHALRTIERPSANHTIDALKKLAPEKSILTPEFLTRVLKQVAGNKPIKDPRKSRTKVTALKIKCIKVSPRQLSPNLKKGSYLFLSQRLQKISSGIEFIDSRVQEALPDLLHKLPQMERDIILSRYISWENSQPTQHEVGQKNGCMTQNTVSGVERSALKRLISELSKGLSGTESAAERPTQAPTTTSNSKGNPNSRINKILFHLYFGSTNIIKNENLEEVGNTMKILGEEVLLRFYLCEKFSLAQAADILFHQKNGLKQKYDVSQIASLLSREPQDIENVLEKL